MVSLLVIERQIEQLREKKGGMVKTIFVGLHFLLFLR